MLNFPNERKRILSKFDDETINVFKSENVFLAGGAITSIFSSKKINDFDLFFANLSHFNRVNEYFGNRDDCVKVMETVSAITYKIYDGKHTVQLISLTQFMSENPIDIINQFDFTICMAIYSFYSSLFYFDEGFPFHLAQRKLIFNPHIKYPFSTLKRLPKFIKRGFTISGTELIKIGMAIQNIQLSTKSDFSRQIAGVDVALLSEFTRNMDGNDPYIFSKMLRDLELYIGEG